MKPTKQQLERRIRSFRFRVNGWESWFYLSPGGCSFHQASPRRQEDVFGVPINRLIRALEDCGYIPQKRKP